MWLRELLSGASADASAAGGKVKPARKHAPLASKVKIPRDRFGTAHKILKEGWLHKKGGSHGGRTNWKRRWFILSPSGLYYFESPQAKESIGVVMLLAETLALLTDRTEKANAFAIMAPDMDPFLCAAADDEERVRWMEAIYTTCTSRGYRESEVDSKRRRSSVDGSRSSLDGGPSMKDPPLPRLLANSAPFDTRVAAGSSDSVALAKRGSSHSAPGRWRSDVTQAMDLAALQQAPQPRGNASVGERRRPASVSLGERPLPDWIDLLGPAAKLEAILERSESGQGSVSHNVASSLCSSQSRSSLHHESGSKRRRSSLEAQRPRAATIG